MKVTKRGLITRAAVSGVSALALAGLVLAGPQTAWARHFGAEPTEEGPDPTAVTACGTLSANTTIYYLTEDITETGTGTCITLSGTGSALLLNGFSITGPGAATSTGDGIHITGTEDLVEGFNGTVSGFEVGIIDTGGGSVGDDFNVTANKTGLELASTATTRWSNFSSFSNTGNGIFFDACGEHCTVFDFSTTDNGGDGLLIQGSTFPYAAVFVAVDNDANGVEVGAASGSANTHAFIADAFLSSPVDAISGNTSGNGIVLDASESAAHDMVTTISASGNGNDSTNFDLHDATATCGDNLWFNNSFGTSRAGTVTTPACIGGLGM